MEIAELERQAAARMAYSRRKAEQIVTGLEDPINQHVLKLLGFDGGPRDHWVRELDTWLTRIGRMVWTRTNRPFDARFYRRILFDEPFGGVEERNIAGMLDLMERQYGETLVRNQKDTAALAAELRRFHERLGDAFAGGTYEPAGIERLR